jgi:serine/threonine protein kinase
MSHFGLVKDQIIYSNPSTSVQIFSGSISKGRIKVAIKEYSHTTMAAANVTISEALSQARLQHPNVCRIYECYLDRKGEEYVCVLVVELLSVDIYAEIERRKVRDEKWCEREIVEFLRQMTSALAYMQENGVSHRDIKPQNIFLTGNILKLGDFGSASRRDSVDPKYDCLAGSPFFLSPELKRILLSRNQGPQTQDPMDLFKADVYSLGVTFLYLVMLRPPTRLMNLDTLVEASEAVIQDLAVSERLRNIFRRMIAIDPATRISFPDLCGLIETTFPSQSIKGSSNPSESSQALQQPMCCIHCDRMIQNTMWTQDVPVHLQVHEDYFPTLCSLQCLVAFNFLASMSQPDKCVSCNSDMSLEPVRLACGHLFHDASCLIYHLFVQVKGNFNQEKEFRCPACSGQSKIADLLSQIDLEAFQQKVNELEQEICARCKVKLAIYKFRGCKMHRFCKDCIGEKPGFMAKCPVCLGAR